MAVGITTFIAGTLARGKKFAIGSGKCGKLGMKIGRATDMLVRKVIDKKIKLSATAPSHSKAVAFFDAMRKNGIVVTEVQRPVKDNDLSIRTVIDAIGQDKTGQSIVIELKTTQHTKVEHGRHYYKPCRNLSTLSNNLPNCLFWRHQLQCGFGMLCTGAKQGLVAVCCSDGCEVYKVEQAATSRHLFQGAVGLPGKTNDTRAPILQWPDKMDAEILALLKKRGYTSVKRHNPTIVSGKPGTAVVLLVHKHASYKTSAVAKNHKKLAKHLAKKHKAAGIIAWVDTAGWHADTVARRAR